MRDAALAHLESLLGQARYAGAEQPDPADLEGALLAYQRIGVVSAGEADRWRVRLAGVVGERDAGPEPPLPEGTRVAASRYLERLVVDVPRLRRNPTPEERTAGAEGPAALEALCAVGVLDERDRTEWSRRLLAAEAPWIEDPPPPGELSVISIPPETPEEAAEDAAFEAAWAARPKAETTLRIVRGSPERHAGLAMIAVAVHEDGTSLHFHFVGEPAPNGQPSRRSIHDAIEGLVPPALHDDCGTTYECVDPFLVSASSHSHEPDSDTRPAIIGSWLYTPAAPDQAATFQIEQADGRWTLPATT